MLLSSAGRVTASRTASDDPDGELPVVTLSVRPEASGRVTIECAAADVRPFDPVVAAVDSAALRALDADATQYGELLGSMVFAPSAAGPMFDELRIALLARAPGFRVRLRVSDPMLAGIRWERLCVPWGKGVWRLLAVNARTPLSRVARYDLSLPPVVPIRGRRLRILLVIASPTRLPAGMGPIDSPERSIIRDAIAAVGSEAVELTVLESGTPDAPTIARVRSALARTPDLVHVLCHGALTADGGVLFLEKDDGSATAWTGEEFATALGALSCHPRLVMLSACESASPASVAGTSAVGPLVVARGADAVLAMHGPLSIATATQFTRSFYDRLYAHGQVDLATAEARAAVVDAWDWSTPVLAMRHDHGRVIDFDVGDLGRLGSAFSPLVANAMGELPREAARENAPQAVIDAMMALQDELGKSHQFLVGLADAFRRTGSDPLSFPVAFAQFRLDFETDYDATTWVPQQTSCHRVRDSWAIARPFVQRVLDAAQFAELDREMNELGSADLDTIRLMGQLLDELKQEVDAIDDRLAANDVGGAIATKRAVERRLSDSFRRSKTFLQTIARHVQTATAA
jgi:phage FluMu protein gp41